MHYVKFAGIVTAVLILLGAAIVAGYFTLWCFVGKGHEQAGDSSSSSPSTNVPPTSSVSYTTAAHLPLPPASNRSIFCHKYKAVPASCPQRRWRNFDASCNNIDNPLWGASFTALRRLLPSRYENKIDAPVGWDRSLRYSGFPLPSTRDVSVGVIGAKTVREDGSVNPFLMSFGQYISHDTDLTRHMKQVNPGLTWFPNGACKDDCSQRVPCFPIPISGSDPRATSGQKCVEFIRSVAMCDPYPDNKLKKVRANPFNQRKVDQKNLNGTNEVDDEEDNDNDNDNDIDNDNNDNGSRRKRSSYAESHNVPMEQANEVTSLIDGSTVYGSTPGLALKLRGPNGTLKVSSQELFLKGLLPFRPTSMGCTPLFGKEIKRLVDVPCFLAGDGRVNEHLGLIVMHTIFHREHNRIVKELSRVNPHWDGDRLFEEARNINAAIHQHVTFKEYLPQVLGPIGMKMIGRYHGYNPLVDPSVSSEFSTAAFRFGHAQIHPIQYRLDKDYQEIPQGHLPIRLTFFSPYRVTEEGGIDPLLRGLVGTRGKLVANDSPLSETVIEELWVLTEKHALDLGALNTQRGRDHALRSYLDYRRYCLLSAPTTWSAFPSIMRRDIATKLEELYGSPENIDLWVGALLEKRLSGADVGPTFTCMLVEGFRRVRDGDRFWYELPTVLTSAQVGEIKKTSLARIVCDNSDSIDRVPSNIFMMTHPDKMTKCHQIAGIDFSKWKEEEEEEETTEDMRRTTAETPEVMTSSTTMPTTSMPTSATTSEAMTTTSRRRTTPFRFPFMPKDDPNVTKSPPTAEAATSSSSSSSTQTQDVKELLKEIVLANPFATQEASVIT